MSNKNLYRKDAMDRLKTCEKVPVQLAVPKLLMELVISISDLTDELAETRKQIDNDMKELRREIKLRNQQIHTSPKLR